MGALIRAFDWSQNPLGPVSQWPQSLRIAVRILLGTGYPMLLCWGSQYTMIYNDGYRPILGKTKHPAALGSPIGQVFTEAMDFIGPRFDNVMARGQDFTVTDQLFILDRNDYLEECYFTFSYSPAPADDGSVGGVLVTALETTERVLDDRRRRILRDLATELAKTHSEQDVWLAAAATLTSEPLTVPFAALYSYHPAERLARLTVSAGGLSSAMCPPIVDLSTGNIWPFSEALTNSSVRTVESLPTRFPDVPATSWGVPPEKAVVLPIALRENRQPAGFLVAGISPRREFDGAYRQFLERSAEQIATGITGARTYEEERRRAAALAELDRAKTLFFSNVSHEFRTPLTLMLGPLEELAAERSSRLTSEQHQHLEVARRNALRLLKLVNTLLDFSRIEAGRVQAVYEPTDLATFTTEIASVFRSAMERAGLSFSVQCEPVGEPVYVDREMWEKIILNLLSNAFKFTFEGEVRVSLRPVDGSVELAVQDTGVGIAEKEQARVFERFHRVENARARTYEGTGIGLSLVQELVKLHGGEVWMESGLGRGSTFTVKVPRGTAHLPADRIGAEWTPSSSAVFADAYVDAAQRWLSFESAEAAGEPASVLARPADSPQGISDPEKDLIVIADDNADMRDYLAHLLKRHYNVHPVPNGKQALEAARKLHPALVLADVMMPERDGFGLLHAIRTDPGLRGTPVILLSARAGEESRVEGLQAGADDYLVKPFTARELIARVSAHVKMAHLRREAADQEARLRAEAERERHRLQELLAQAPAAIGLMSGPEYRWVYVNEQYVRITGRSNASDFLGKTLTESLPELESQPFVDLLDDVYRTGKPYVGREVLAILNRSHTGQPAEAYFDFVYQPLTDVDGMIEGILVHAVEVTDKVIARRAIEQSEQRFRALVNATSYVVYRMSPDWSEMRQLDGQGFISDTQQPTTNWMDIYIHPDDQPALLEAIERAVRTKSVFQLEYRVRRVDGTLGWAQSRAVPLFNQNGEITEWFGAATDVTARKQAEEAQRRLAAIVESSDDAIVSKDLNGIVTSWNPAAEKMFGYTAEEMVGCSILRIIPPELHHDEEHILATIGRGQRIEHFETVRLTKRGERIDVSLTISPVKDETGRIRGAAKIARDITQQKRTEHALRTTERLAAVGRLAATVAHEINNPLAAVTNLIYLSKQNAVRADVREFLTVAEEELERISHLTKQTLGFYREAKAPTATLGSVVDSTISVFASRARNKGIALRSEIKPDLETYAVPSELRQLLGNLLSNSIDAVGAGGRIRIRVSAATRHGLFSGGVRLTVADSGPGIPNDIRALIFEPFFTTKKDVGTGLGLWICKSIVDRYHGSMRTWSSVVPGRSGTIVSVVLPASTQGHAEDEALRQAV